MSRRQIIWLSFAGAVTLAAAVLWFNSTFTVMSTLRGDEFLILRAEQATECKASGGCAVFSEREFSNSVSQILRRYLTSREGHGIPAPI